MEILQRLSAFHRNDPSSEYCAYVFASFISSYMQRGTRQDPIPVLQPLLAAVKKRLARVLSRISQDCTSLCTGRTVPGLGEGALPPAMQNNPLKAMTSEVRVGYHRLSRLQIISPVGVTISSYQYYFKTRSI